jgi:hypothetical protein
LSHKQDTREDHDLNITNEVFENVTEFRYLWTMLRFQSDMHEEIRSTLNLWIACYLQEHD